MVEKVITLGRNVIDFARYQQDRHAAANELVVPARTCRHCGAALSEGEREDECSSAFNTEARDLRRGPRKFRAD
jgi:predicted nucleic acid-binding Zn ribbon protein